jgi:hypothetical protein
VGWGSVDNRVAAFNVGGRKGRAMLEGRTVSREKAWPGRPKAWRGRGAVRDVAAPGTPPDGRGPERGREDDPLTLGFPRGYLAALSV